MSNEELKNNTPKPAREWTLCELALEVYSDAPMHKVEEPRQRAAKALLADAPLAEIERWVGER